MLDIRWMREHRAELAEAMQKLNATDAPWEKALDLDERRRELLTRVEALRAEQVFGGIENLCLGARTVRARLSWRSCHGPTPFRRRPNLSMSPIDRA